MRKLNLEDKYDLEELKDLNAKQWQIDCLFKNPDYVWWGNYEDYMCKDSSKGWESSIELENVDELIKLDELNEIVNFYFEITRKNHECPHCKGSGLNKETYQLNEDWYDFDRTGKRWCDKITQNEVDALWDANRLHSYFKEKPTAEQVNEWQKKDHGHDTINRWICVEARAKKLGVYGHCEHCNGKGVIYDSEEATLSLQMWLLHPRKGASRGVYLKEIKENEVEKVINYLKEARERNYDRFSKL